MQTSDHLSTLLRIGQSRSSCTYGFALKWWAELAVNEDDTHPGVPEASTQSSTIAVSAYRLALCREPLTRQPTDEEILVQKPQQLTYRGCLDVELTARYQRCCIDTLPIGLVTNLLDSDTLKMTARVDRLKPTPQPSVPPAALNEEASGVSADRQVVSNCVDPYRNMLDKELVFLEQYLKCRLATD